MNEKEKYRLFHNRGHKKGYEKGYHAGYTKAQQDIMNDLKKYALLKDKANEVIPRICMACAKEI